jgi:hypothetical protein
MNANVPSSSGASVTVEGLNFHSVDVSPNLVIGATGCGTTTWTSSSSLGCVPAVGVGGYLAQQLTLGNLVGTGHIMFSYDAPAVSYANNWNAPTSSGTSVTLLGSNFGGRDYSQTAAIGVTACATTAYGTMTSVLCLSPNGVGDLQSPRVASGQLSGTMNVAFSYDSPVITRVTTYNGPTTAGTSITVYGTNFGVGDGTPSTGVGVTACGTTSWSTATAVVCQNTQDGSYNDKRINVMLGSFGTIESIFTYDSPTITFTTNMNSASSGGYSVTLSGVNFGNVDLSPSVQVGSTLCATTSWHSSTVIQCEGPIGSGAALKTNVIHTMFIGTQLTAFSYDSPVVSYSISPNSVVSGGSSVTLHGFNFAMSDLTNTVALGQTACGTASWTTISSITCLSGSGAGAAQSIKVEASSVIGTALGTFTFDSPTVSHIMPKNAPTTSGALITVQGHNFAKGDFTVTAQIGKTACSTTSWTTLSSVLCRTNAGTGLLNLLSATVGAVVGTNSNVFSYDAPAVTAVGFNAPATAGTPISVSGTNFGFEDTTPTVKLGSTSCTTAVWSSASSILCMFDGQMDNENSLMLDVSLTTSRNVGSFLDVFTYDAPVVTSSQNSNAPGSSDTTITVLGFNFSPVDRSSTIRVGVSSCEQTEWNSDTSLRCLVAIGSGIENSIAITMSGLISTGFKAFSYDSPIITYVNRWNAPTTSGGTVTISGTNFGLSDLTLSIAVGESLCATSSWQTYSSVNCLTADGSGMARELAMTITSQVGTGAAAFTYDAPIMSSFTLRNSPTAGGAAVSIFGTNLASVGKSSVQVGATLCQTTAWISGSLIVCQPSAGVGHRQTAQLTVDAVVGTSTSVLTYDSPVATYFNSFNGPTSGGASLTVTGFNFGNEDASPELSVMPSGNKCSTVSWQTGTSLLCNSPEETGESKPMSVSVSEVIGSALDLFSYDSPVVTYITQYNAPSSGAASLTIVGQNFGTSSSAAREMRIGVTACGTYSWRSDSAVVCASTVGYGSSVMTQVTVDALVGTLHSAFTYDAPVITSLLKTNAPTSASATITVFGNNFLNVDTSPEGRIGDSICLTTSWTTQTSLNCVHPAGTGGEHRVSVTMMGQVGSNLQAFTYGAPVISFVERFNAPTSSGATVTISGKNFGYKDPSPTAKIGVTFCKKTTWIGTTSILCITPSGIGSDMMLGLDVASLVGTKMMHFSYDAPVITQSFISNGPAKSGTTITIFGTNFAERGDALTGGAGVPKVLVAGEACQSTWESPTSLTCTTPHGTGSARAVGAIVGSLVGTQAATFTYDAPLITHVLSPNTPVSGATMVTIQGHNFAMSDTTPTAMMGMSICSTTAWISNSQVTCVTQPGSGQQLPITVQVTKVYGTGMRLFSYDAPVVTSTGTENGVTSAQTQLTISGFNFGNTDLTASAIIGGTTCQVSQWISGTSIMCETAPGQGADSAMGVNLNNVIGTLGAAFSFDAPVISQVTQTNGPLTGQSEVIVMGLNFGSDRNPNSRLGLTSCQSNAWRSVTSISCFVPPGYNPEGVMHGVAVSVAGVVGQRDGVFSYDGPALTHAFSPNQPTTAGGSITLTGKNFGRSNFSPLARLGVTACLTTSWLSDTAMLCRAPSGSGALKGMSATIGAVVGTALETFTYDSPALTSVNTPNGPVAGATDVTLNGFNFGLTSKLSTVEATIGENTCSTSAWKSDTSVLCRTPAGYDVARSATLTVTTYKNSVVGMVESLFSYDCPVVSHVSSTNLPMDGAALLTIYGTNFGTDDYNPAAYVGPTKCTATSWISPSTIQCSTPQGGASLLSQLDVTVNVGGCSGRYESIAYFDEASKFDPFVTFPQTYVDEDGEEYSRAEVTYLSCGPDFEEDLLPKDFADRTTVMLTNGASIKPDGIVISSTGVGAVNERLFSIPLGVFKWDATYRLEMKVSGQFNYNADTAIIYGIGNGTHFIGVKKEDYNSALTGTAIEGTYDAQSPLVEVKSFNLNAWNEVPTMNEKVSTLTVEAYTLGSQPRPAMRLTFTQGGVTSIVSLPNLNLEGIQMGMELVAFREAKNHMFTIDRIQMSLSGCTPASTV